MEKKTINTITPGPATNNCQKMTLTICTGMYRLDGCVYFEINQDGTFCKHCSKYAEFNEFKLCLNEKAQKEAKETYSIPVISHLKSTTYDVG